MAMKTTFLLLALTAPLAGSLFAQPDAGNANRGYRNFPVIVSLQFHALAVPFRDIKANFSNVGIGVGTELRLNNNASLVQQVSGVWYRNRAAGNGLLFSTQTAWRPKVAGRFYTEIKAGVGYLQAFRPVESFVQVNGKWQSVGNKGKGRVTVPLGFSFGYDLHPGSYYMSPFISYQLLAVTGYNTSVPLVPETLIQVGSRMHFQ
jgi:hypothetical protein